MPKMSVRANRLPKGILSAVAVATALAMPGAEPKAQQIGTDADDVEFEEIVVTGSRLKRRDFNSPSPIMTIDNETLAFSGQATLEQILNQMPQVSPDFGRSANNPGNGTARINLRGLGSGRTLVMLNGRRLAPSGVGSSVNVNNLPQALVDRVEIITGGASTAYGSDAIAGVVNFVTHKDFDGFGLDTSAYVTEEGDSNIYDLNVTYGHNFANGNGNITLFGGYFDRQPTFQADREFTSIPYFDTWAGTIVQGGSSATPEGVVAFPRVDYGNGPSFTTFDQNGVPREFLDPQDRYNYAPVNYLQTPLTRYSGGVFLNYELTGALETYFEVTHTRNEARQNLAPVPLFDFLQTNLDNPVLSPEAQQVFADNFIPDPADRNIVSFSFRRRLLELGPRIADTTFDYSRVVAGMRGDLGDNWDFDVWLTYTKGEEEILLSNDASRSRARQGLLVDPVTGQCYDPSNGCVPLNMFGPDSISAEGIAFIRYPDFVNVASRTQKLASAVVTGSPLDSWAGPIQTALGIEWRDDTGNFKADDALFTGDALGFRGSSSVVGSESIFEVYAEALVPLAGGVAFAEHLTVEFGGRYSEYKNAGSVNTYKLGGEWQPTESIRFRSMYQRSVRAPNLQEAFQEQLTENRPFVRFDPRDDPCTASADPVGNGNAEKCIGQGLPAALVGIWEAVPEAYVTEFVTGGNPELRPETAETLTIGAVMNFAALENWQISVDYFELEVEDTIGDIDAALICFDPLNTEGLFCSNIERDPLTYDISRVFEPTSNRGKLRTTGFDTQINYETDLPDALAIGDSGADLNVNLIWTHMSTNSIQQSPVATVVDCAGLFGWPCNFDTDTTTFPHDRVTTNANYHAGDLSIHLTWRWIAGTDTANHIGAEIFGIGEIDPGVPTVSQRNYVDLGFGYRFSDNIVARFNVANLLDTNPPMMADNADVNTDSGMYDLFGRSYTLSFSLQY